MGELISKYEYLDHRDTFNSLIVIPKDIEDIESIFESYCKLNIGLELSKRLRKISVAERDERIEKELDLLIGQLDDEEIIVDNIDLLFNPQYKLNVQSYFIKKGRNKKVVLTWPGTMKNEKLYYSEFGLSDYIEIDINKHNIVYVY